MGHVLSLHRVVVGRVVVVVVSIRRGERPRQVLTYDGMPENEGFHETLLGEISLFQTIDLVL